MLVSTRDNETVSSSKAILKGLSSVGGLFIFDKIESIGFDQSFLLMSYEDMALKILSHLFSDIDEKELGKCIKNAYNKKNFPEGCVTVKSFDDYAFLNLFNGPTFAFKDMALTLLPYLVELSKKIENNKKKTVVLTATSGDTGSAALNGFTKLKNTYTYVLYPYGKVSQFQERQMLSFNGKNATSFAVKGNFDDCQRTVKEFFSKEKYDTLDLSSANSINIGRLVPQIVYYFYSYCKLVNMGKITYGDEINFTVPTGNFGNILAGYIAKKLGLPIKKLICASNKNDVLTEFMTTGEYNASREFYTTNSPSMDILVSSNLERLLFLFGKKDPAYVSKLMNDLKTNKKYRVSVDIKERLDENFACGSIDEKKTVKLIKDEFAKENHLMDPHTAVAFGVYKNYKKESKDKTFTVIVSTANPYKFSDTICKALDIEPNKDEFVNIENISELTGLKIDKRIIALKKAKTNQTIWDLEKTMKNLEDVVGDLDD